MKIRLGFTSRSEWSGSTNGVQLSDLAVELLDPDTRALSVARPRSSVRLSDAMSRAGVQGEPQHVDPYFTSETFLSAYLNPVTPVGCASHENPACLCDVDVAATRGIEWNLCPTELINVESADELVEVAANIWLRLDVLAYPAELTEALATHERMPELLEAIKQNVEYGVVKQIVPINVKTFQLLRKLFGVCRVRKSVPAGRVIELAQEGISGTRAQTILFEETGVLHSLTALRKVRVRAGYTAKVLNPGPARQFPHEQIWELFESGLKPAQIAAVVTDEGTSMTRKQVSDVLARVRAKMDH